MLVIGCGAGEAALFLAREYPRARVRGVDGSAEMIRKASARVGLDPEGRIAFKVGRPRSLPYPDGFFDLVAQIDSNPALAEIARVLLPGGYLILAQTGGSRITGLLAPLLRRRLSHHRIEPIETADAGDGSFLLGRRISDA